MMQVANPIYDIVFKYLMEDERIAKMLISALLKKDVVSIEQRRNEYSNVTRDSLSIFRIDFGAMVREDDGEEHFVLIELQKTWLETETLRFRQYLGAQYANPENIKKDDRYGYAIPMVTVYLLGHKVGDIEEPIIYVKRKSYDYDDNLIEKGLPNPFVDSLTHDSIIVQIPRLHGQLNNRLETVLNVFDQTRKDPNPQTITVDENLYKDNDDMLYILHRLYEASSDTKLRHDMNVEDEYFSAIEKRDTEILMRDKMLAEQKTRLAEQKNRLAEQKSQLDEQKSRLDEQKSQLDEQKSQLDEQRSQLDEQKSQLDEQKSQLDEQKSQLDEQKKLIASSVKMLLAAGMSEEVICQNLRVTREFVESCK